MSLHHRGDDLEDDFVPDDTLALDDEDEDQGEAPDTAQVDLGRLLTPDDREGDQDAAAAPAAKSDDIDADRIGDKKRKRKRRDKQKERKRRKLAEAEDARAAENGHGNEGYSIAAQSPTKLAAHLASVQAKAFPKMSALELQDRAIPESAIADTTGWKDSRTLDRLEDFIVHAVPSLHTRLLQKTKSPGAPTLLFITPAALRVADVARVLRASRVLRGEKGGDVAKLFARHFKLGEHVEYLKKTKVGSAVGTPGRVGKLLCETDALTTSALSHVVLDVSHKDAKGRSLLNIPETRDEVFGSVLGAPSVMEGIRAGKVQVVLF